MKHSLRFYLENYRTFLLYALYGIPSTVVSFGGYFLLMDWLGMEAFLSNAIAWVGGLLISFFLYRRFVFHTQGRGFLVMAREFLKFTGLRIFSGLFETGFVWLFVDMLHWQRTVFKIVASLLAALLNYFVSKFFVFAHRSGPRPQ